LEKALHNNPVALAALEAEKAVRPALAGRGSLPSSVDYIESFSRSDTRYSCLDPPHQGRFTEANFALTNSTTPVRSTTSVSVRS